MQVNNTATIKMGAVVPMLIAVITVFVTPFIVLCLCPSNSFRFNGKRMGFKILIDLIQSQQVQCLTLLL